MTIDIKQAAEFLKEHDNFLILSHANPDGDTMGCSHALCGALQQLGKKARIECADPLSERFSYMKNGIETEEFEPDTIVSLDVADRRLLGSLDEAYGGKVQLCIDHHLSHVYYAERTLVDPDAAASCEIVYEVIKETGAKITNEIAACLYTGIATDTGCFKFSNTTPHTHIIAAQLMECDFDFGGLNYTLFDMKTKARISLEEQVLNKMEFFCGDKCALVVLTKEMMDSVDSEDCNGLSSLPRQIEGVEVGVTLKEKDGEWKASLRSASTIDVQKICVKLGGGGHLRAAGCSVKGDLETAKRIVIDAITAEMKSAGLVD